MSEEKVKNSKKTGIKSFFLSRAPIAVVCVVCFMLLPLAALLIFLI